jgi:hypothetical protein
MMFGSRKFMFIATKIPVATYDCNFLSFTTPTDLSDNGITYSRGGLGTYINSTGKVVFNRHNLCLQSEAMNLTWTASQTSVTYPVSGQTSPIGTSTVTRINENTNPGSSHSLLQNFSPSGTRDYIYNASVYLKEDTASSPARPTVVLNLSCGTFGAIAVAFDLRNGVVLGSPSIRSATEATGYGMENAGNGWYRCWVRMLSSYTMAQSLISFNIAGVNTAAGVVPTLSNGGIPQYNGAGATAGWFAWGAQLEACTEPQSYIPTTTSIIVWPRLVPNNGLLLEPSVTNLLNWSERFLTSGGSVMNWVYTSLSTSTGSISPNGATNALVFTHTGAGPKGIVAASVPVGSSNSRTLSFWARRVTGTGIVWYSIDNGTTQIPLTNLTTTWQRYVFDATTANHQIALGLDTANDAVEFWGIQLENAVGTISATSYITTTNFTVARASDNIGILAANLGFWDNTIGSIVVEGSFTTSNSLGLGMFRAGTSNSNQNMMMSQRFSASNRPFYRRIGTFYESGPASSLTIPSVNVLYKTGLQYTSSTFTGFLNGNEGTTLTIPSNITTDKVEFFVTATNNINAALATVASSGFLRRFRYWNSALSIQDMNTLTT